MRLIVGLCLLGLFLIAGILYAIYQAQAGIEDARLRGVITAKNFEPQPEQQITFGRGGLNKTDTKGEYTFNVQVKNRDGSVKDYIVFVDQTRYEAHDIGDTFDVGPYLVAPPPTPPPSPTP